MRAILTPSCGIARQIQPARNQEHNRILTTSAHAVHDRHYPRGNPDQAWNHVVVVLARPADFAAGVLLAFRRWLFAWPAGLAFCGHCVFPVCVLCRNPQTPRRAFRRTCAGSSVGSVCAHRQPRCFTRRVYQSLLPGVDHSYAAHCRKIHRP